MEQAWDRARGDENRYGFIRHTISLTRPFLT